jgi:hypothetical protein
LQGSSRAKAGCVLERSTAVDAFRTVVLVGFPWELPLSRELMVRRVPVSPGLESALLPGEATVVVAGDEALAAMDPERVRKRLRPPRTILIQVATDLLSPSLARWRKGRTMAMATLSSLAQAIEEAARTPVRPAVPMRAWQPRGLPRRSESRWLLDLVPGLHDLTVECWARSARMSARSLRARCRRDFAMRAEDLIFRYKDAVVRRELRAGLQSPGLAFSVGYANESNLRNAYRRRGLRLPRRSGARARRMHRD